GRHLGHELRRHAGAAHALGLSRGTRRDGARVGGHVLAAQTRGLAIGTAREVGRESYDQGGWYGAAARRCASARQMRALPLVLSALSRSLCLRGWHRLCLISPDGFERRPK